MGRIHARRISALRALMLEKGWDAVVVSGSDPHSSEYPAPRWKQVEWLSGFTGEAGEIVVTQDHAGLWTDTRYFIQAVEQLEGSGVELHKLRVPGQVLIPRWLALEAFTGYDEAPVIAVDGLCQSTASIRAIRSEFRAVSGLNDADEDAEDPVRIISVPDLLEAVWDNRPAVPQTPIITLGVDIVGESRQDKIMWLRNFLYEKGCDAILLTALDEIAWLLNVRGSDIAYNPLVISYLLVTQDEVDWYVRKGGTPDQETRDSFYELKSDGIRIFEYDDISLAVAGMLDDGYIRRLFVDPATLNYDLHTILENNALKSELVTGASPVSRRKAVKNEVEIAGMREAHFEDGLAMERFLYWLERQLEIGAIVTEWDAARQLGALRARIPGYRGDSFETISAYGPGAALPHYITPAGDDAPRIEPKGLYLVDSGGQYLFGTTDITRTIPVGPCTPLEKEDYTLVLKGHIGLAMAVFPKGTAGCQLDVLARNPLWQSKRNFGHGTGHGVGFFLGVHEGPQDIRQNFNAQPLLPGMITSDEPGIYREGKHGVRHESLLLCTEAGTNEFGTWLAFENLTLCHIDTSVIVRNVLTEGETAWLNAYNEHVYQALYRHLPEVVAAWLREKTKPI